MANHSLLQFLYESDLINATTGSIVQLEGADLSGAKLSGANLRDANLMGSELAGADLTGADVAGANFNQADVNSARLVSLRGKATVLHDAHRARELWSTMAGAWFPGGPDDPNLGILPDPGKCPIGGL